MNFLLAALKPQNVLKKLATLHSQLFSFELMAHTFEGSLQIERKK